MITYRITHVLSGTGVEFVGPNKLTFISILYHSCKHVKCPIGPCEECPWFYEPEINKVPNKVEYLIDKVKNV
jgi:hypothetical protein